MQPPSWVLFATYLAVMGAAYGCFLRAFATRKNTPVHKRWGLTGVGLDMAGTAVVLVVHRGFGWSLPHRDEALVLWHRGFAYATTAMVLLIAFTGWRRMPLHHPPLAGVPAALRRDPHAGGAGLLAGVNRSNGARHRNNLQKVVPVPGTVGTDQRGGASLGGGGFMRSSTVRS